MLKNSQYPFKILVGDMKVFEPKKDFAEEKNIISLFGRFYENFE